MANITNASNRQLPFDYRKLNEIESYVNPGTMHASDTGLAWYFKKYLFQKILSVYEWNGIPEHWAKNYFEYILFGLGKIAIIETDKFGVIPQQCGLSGNHLSVMYQPTYVTIANPLLRGLLMPQIGIDCELIKIQPNYGGVWDIVSYYADMLACCSETIAVNIMNSKLSYVFFSENKTMAETFKKMTDSILSGQPAVFIGKELMMEDGTPLWQVFTQDLSSNYIADKLLMDMQKWENRFDTEIGIPNANTEKRERMLVDEVNANNFSTMSKAELWLETIRECLEKVNEMFDLNISVKFRNQEEMTPQIERGDADVFE